MLVPLGEPGGRTAWTVTAPDGRVFAVFAVEGRLHVTDARCPHNKGPLVEGTIDDGRTLVCPWHLLRFDLATGRCVDLRMYKLGVYPVLQRDGEWFADVGDAPRWRRLSERLRAHAPGH